MDRVIKRILFLLFFCASLFSLASAATLPVVFAQQPTFPQTIIPGVGKAETYTIQNNTSVGLPLTFTSSVSGGTISVRAAGTTCGTPARPFLPRNSQCNLVFVFRAPGQGSYSGTISIDYQGRYPLITNTLSFTSKAITGISITPKNSAVGVGNTLQYTATATYDDNTTEDVTNSVDWSSSNGAVATISATGLASGISAGSTTISATLGAFSDSTPLSVAVATLLSITISPASATIPLLSGTQQYTATGNYSFGASQNITNSVTWNSSNTSIATIDSSGLATAVHIGTTNITASLTPITSQISPLTVSATGALAFQQNGIAITSINISENTSGTITLKNTGGSIITGLSLNLAPSITASLSSNCGSSLTAGNSCTITYTNMTANTHSQFSIVASGTTGLGATVTANLAITVYTAGGLKCWGDNSNGELGNGTTDTSNTPVNVSGLTDATNIKVAEGADHNCALLTSGGMQCWGNNSFGQLGTGNNTPSTTPVTVNGLSSGVTQITSGGYHTCALLSSGAIQCWGRNNFGQLGNGNTIDQSSPVNVNFPSSAGSAITLSAGVFYTCSVMSSGAVYCWGGNDGGQLGQGTIDISPHSIPLLVIGLNGSNITSLQAGGYNACALLSNGTATCWGNNTEGELGRGTCVSSGTPAMVSGLTNATSLMTGQYHSCALLSGGTAKCWGKNQFGELGNQQTLAPNACGPTNNVPQNVTVSLGGANLSNIGGIAANGQGSCALIQASSHFGMQCWGNNTFGQVGNGAFATSQLNPVSVIGLTTDVYSSFEHSMGNYSCAVVAPP